MYTRPRTTENEPLRIPENYSGNAFHSDSHSPSPPIDIPTETPETESPPTEESEAGTASKSLPVSVALTSESHEDTHITKKASPFSPLLPPRMIGGRGGLLGDIGIEELLIIGILILLSQSDTDDDILLLLVLLLFYK